MKTHIDRAAQNIVGIVYRQNIIIIDIVKNVNIDNKLYRLQSFYWKKCSATHRHTLSAMMKGSLSLHSVGTYLANVSTRCSNPLCQVKLLRKRIFHYLMSTGETEKSLRSYITCKHSARNGIESNPLLWRGFPFILSGSRTGWRLGRLNTGGQLTKEASSHLNILRKRSSGIIWV